MIIPDSKNEILQVNECKVMIFLCFLGEKAIENEKSCTKLREWCDFYNENTCI